MFGERKFLVKALVVVTAVFFASMAGCAKPAKKPAVPSPATPGPSTPAPANKPMPTSPAELSKMADRLAVEAEKEPGVKKATVVISGSAALVGLELKTGTAAKAAGDVKSAVEKRLKKAEPGLTSVKVTTDAAIISRLKEVARGIAAGKPLSSFSSQMADILRLMSPKTK